MSPAKTMNDIAEIATNTLLLYMQEWGQTIEKKVVALNKAVEVAGIKAIFVQDDYRSGWKSETKEEAKRAIAFRKELDHCWTGNFETEVEQIRLLILKARENKADVPTA